MQRISDIAAIAAQVTIDASEVALKNFRHNGLQIELKGDESPVTKADRETENFIRNALAHHFPNHSIWGEEFGVTGDLINKSWIIDPIDGTRFYISGYPTFGILMAHLDGKEPKIGVVRMPVLNETYVGFKDGYATCNNQRISSSETTNLSDAKLFINEAEKTFQDNPDRFGRLCKTGHTRRMSYDCYPHAMVAAGHIDCVTDIGLEPYDYLPLVALVEAAGGIMTDWNGDALTLESEGRVVTAATPELHSELLELLNE